MRDADLLLLAELLVVTVDAVRLDDTVESVRPPLRGFLVLAAVVLGAVADCDPCPAGVEALGWWKTGAPSLAVN